MQVATIDVLRPVGDTSPADPDLCPSEASDLGPTQADLSPPAVSDLEDEIYADVQATSVGWVLELFERQVAATGVQPQPERRKVLLTQLKVLAVMAKAAAQLQEVIVAAGEDDGLTRADLGSPDPGPGSTPDTAPEGIAAGGASPAVLPVICMQDGRSPEAAAEDAYAKWCALNLLGGEDDIERFQHFTSLMKFGGALSAFAADGRRTPTRALRDRGLKPGALAREVGLDPKRISVLYADLDGKPDTESTGK